MSSTESLGSSTTTSTNTNGIKSTLSIEDCQVTFTKGGKWKSRTKLEKCLIVFSIILFLLLITFVVLFALFTIKSEVLIGVLEQILGFQAMAPCMTPSCVSSAASVIAKMDMRADPCVDFSQYACGQFWKNTFLPVDQLEVSAFMHLYNENYKRQKNILETESSEMEENYQGNMKNLYRSCMDEASIERIGLNPYKDSDYAKLWPSINNDWSEKNFDLNDVIKKYNMEHSQTLFSFSVSADLKDSNVNAVYLQQPAFKIPQEVYSSYKREHSLILAYENYYKQYAIALGADAEVAAEDAKGVVDLERSLSTIMIPKQFTRDYSFIYNPVTLKKLTEEDTVIDYTQIVQDMFSEVGVNISENDTVINAHIDYIKQLPDVLANSSSRAIQNLHAWTHARLRLTGLTKEIHEIDSQLNKAFYGVSQDVPRWKECADYTAKAFKWVMGKEFVSDVFSKDSKQFINEMIVDLKASFREILTGTEWMGEVTKSRALDKLSSMDSRIGYPDEILNDTYLNDIYKHHTFTANKFYDNKVILDKTQKVKSLQKLLQPVDRSEWINTPFDVNAAYFPTQNTIGFPAGILQPPFFSSNNPASLNYGAIGSVIGHEITHGFDDQGMQYDKEGNLVNWWQKDDYDQFKKKVQCVIDKYGQYVDPEVNMTINGINTQGENVADIGGVKEAFRAYKKYVMKHGKQTFLPGMRNTPDQIFFLGFAQIYCEKASPVYLKQQIQTGVHATKRTRILGTLKNTPEFAQAFRCPVGSPMNPEHKCVVW